MAQRPCPPRGAVSDSTDPPTRRGLGSMAPLGALAAGFGFVSLSMAQTATPAIEPALPQVTVKGAAEQQGKDGVRATTTTIGKGQQELRDIPQSITVVTEKLLDDRNLDTLKDALRSTAGITFQAAEGQEEDIRLRGFSLQSTGDIFIDGMRDSGFYDRDSFNWDRLEVLRGSASMLFGRGSTGGAVNQVNKYPLLIDQNEIAVTLGNGSYLRAVGDFNLKTGDNAAFRVAGMVTAASNYGNRIDKEGIAPSYRWGIGTSDEFTVALYHLDYKNGVHYGIPWLQEQIVKIIDPKNYYGAGSDYAAGGTTYTTLSHTHRFGGGDELKTTLRFGEYERDQRASAIRFAAAALQPGGLAVTQANVSNATVLNRGSQNKIQDMQTKALQVDYTGNYKWFGLGHAVLAGADLAIDDFTRYATVTPAGVTIPGKPTTTIGTPNDGGSVNESLRSVRRSQAFDANALGLYAQDMMQFAQAWKALAGLRWDRFDGTYRTFSTADATLGNQTALRGRTDSLWSHRLGLLFQPTLHSSYHLSYGTSFNTSGDTYSFDPLGSNTPPEKSRNIEFGGSIDWADGRFTTRFALFHATKYNERNTDEDSVTPTNYVLSGKRHAAGIDLDFAGRITPAWELFAAYEFIPDAKVDAGASNGTTLVAGETVGARPAMTPRHSGTMWTTYKITPNWRVGGGLNARSGVKPLLVNFYAPRFVTADLMAEYLAGPLSFKFNLFNVTNKLYADQLYRGHYIPGRGRTAQMTVAYKF